MNDTAPDPRSLPKALWIGTAFFFLIAAVVLVFMLQEGEERSAAESTAKLEGQSITLSAEQMKRLRREAAPGSGRRRSR